MADTTLQGTIQTGSKQDTAQTDAARKRRESLRKGIISLYGRGFDDSSIRQKAYERGGFDPQEIESVLSEYKQMKESGFSGPTPKEQKVKQSIPAEQIGADIDQMNLSNDQRLNLGFGRRMKSSDDTITQLEDEIAAKGTMAGLSHFIDNLQTGSALTQRYVPEDFQKFDQAQRDFVNAVLRRESGAVISPEEFDNARKQYFPLPGDTPEVVAQKRANRQLVAKNFLQGAGVDTDTILFGKEEVGKKEEIKKEVSTTDEEKIKSPLYDPETGEIKSSGFFDTIGEEVPKFFGKVANRISDTYGAISEEAQRGQAPNIFGEAGLHLAGGAAGIVNDAFTSVFNIGVSALPDAVRETASKTMESILSTDAGKAGLFALQQGGQMYEEFKKNNPEIARDIEDVANIAAAIPAGKALSLAGTEGKNIVGDTMKAASGVRTLATGSTPITKANEQIFRAVKPSITGGKKLDQVKKSMELATEEVANRGFKPTNFEEYTKALGDTKRAVWNDIENKIGASNATVNLRSIADDVLGMADNETMKRIDPKAVTKLQKIAETLTSQGDNISVADAESLKQYINAELAGTFGKFKLSNAEQNAKKLITAKIGEQLDSVLSNVPGEFSGLKKKYGALRQAEEDALKRLTVFGRQNPQSLVESFSKISGIGNIIKGIATASPADIAKGAGELVLGKIQKAANDADTIIKKAFEGISKSNEGYKSKLFNIRPGLNIQDVSGGKPGYPKAGTRTLASENPLLQEAGKYETLEEFVKAQSGKSDVMVKAERYSEARGDTGVFHDAFRIYDKNTGKKLDTNWYTSKASAQEVADKITKSQLTDIWNKANKATPENHLLQEAGKYETLEKFVDNLVFRGQSKDGEWFIPKVDKRTGLPKTISGYEGIPVSSDFDYVKKEFASKYNKASEVRAFSIKEGAKVLDNPEEIQKLAGVGKPETIYFDINTGRKISSPKFGEAGTLRKIKEFSIDDPTLYRNAKKAGYDVVDLRKLGAKYKITGLDAINESELRILNSDVLIQVSGDIKNLTKSQLTDLWKKAHKK